MEDQVLKAVMNPIEPQVQRTRNQGAGEEEPAVPPAPSEEGMISFCDEKMAGVLLDLQAGQQHFSQRIILNALSNTAQFTDKKISNFCVN